MEIQYVEYCGNVWEILEDYLTDGDEVYLLISNTSNGDELTVKRSAVRFLKPEDISDSAADCE